MKKAKLILSASLPLFIFIMGLVACQKEEQLPTNETAVSDEAAVDRETAPCNCEVRFNSITDDSGLNKPIKLWEFTFMKPTNGPAISFTGSPVGSECPAGPSVTQLGVWYPLPSTVCSKLCSTIWFSATSGTCLEQWRAKANLSIRSGGGIKTFDIIANSHNAGNPNAPGSKSYRVINDPTQIPGTCVPTLCQ